MYQRAVGEMRAPYVLKRSTTGAYIASATVYSAPKSHGPPLPKRCRMSFQISSIRSMSDSSAGVMAVRRLRARAFMGQSMRRLEEHTSELQSPCNLVCRLLLEKKKHTK